MDTPSGRLKGIAGTCRAGSGVARLAGLLHAATLRDERSARLVGLMVWTSREDWEAGIGRARAAVEHDDFDLWEERGPELFLLDEV